MLSNVVLSLKYPNTTYARKNNQSCQCNSLCCSSIFSFFCLLQCNLFAKVKWHASVKSIQKAVNKRRQSKLTCIFYFCWKKCKNCHHKRVKPGCAVLLSSLFSLSKLAVFFLWQPVTDWCIIMSVKYVKEMDFVCKTCHYVLITQDFKFCLFGFGEDRENGLGIVCIWKIYHVRAETSRGPTYWRDKSIFFKRKKKRMSGKFSSNRNLIKAVSSKLDRILINVRCI